MVKVLKLHTVEERENPTAVSQVQQQAQLHLDTSHSFQQHPITEAEKELRLTMHLTLDIIILSQVIHYIYQVTALMSLMTVSMEYGQEVESLQHLQYQLPQLPQQLQYLAHSLQRLLHLHLHMVHHLLQQVTNILYQLTHCNIQPAHLHLELLLLISPQ